MDFDYDADQLGLLEFGKELAGRFEDAYWQEADLEYRFPREFWSALTEHGLLGLTVPEEYGGSGKGLLELAIAVEGIAEGGGGMEGGTLLVSGPVFGGCILTRHGNAEQKRRYLPGLVTGDLWAGAFTEPESGSNISAIKTKAERGEPSTTSSIPSASCSQQRPSGQGCWRSARRSSTHLSGGSGMGRSARTREFSSPSHKRESPSRPRG